ncbi:endonuclease/exonuclease/phosphatase family protein [Kitasatospora albolonga]|uniref:endonuclease/exonuclease/phosphatase family protein n=1 Tax=Kitasatospora albolonga TaxID=68173 RepID=UPI003CD06F38
MARLTGATSDAGEPVLLAGDFNATPQDAGPGRAVQPLRAAAGSTRRRTRTTPTSARCRVARCARRADRGAASARRRPPPRRRIDYLFLSARDFRNVKGGRGALHPAVGPPPAARGGRVRGLSTPEGAQCSRSRPLGQAEDACRAM